MSIIDRVDNPFKSEEFRSTTLGLSSMAERLAIERLINRLVIDWRNSGSDFYTSGAAQLIGKLTGTESYFSGTTETEEFVTGRLDGIDGGDFTSTIEIIDTWGAVHVEIGLDGGDFTGTPLAYLDAGRFVE